MMVDVDDEDGDQDFVDDAGNGLLEDPEGPSTSAEEFQAAVSGSFSGTS